MPRADFAILVQRFFAEYLDAQRNLSVHTRTGYRDAFRLLLQFLAVFHRRTVDHLDLKDFTPEAVLAFLDHLEHSRGNNIRTRNLRLAAVRSFVRFILGQSAAVDFLGTAKRILTIPQKQCPKPIFGFMTRDEITAVLAAVDQHSWSGRRDFLLFTLLYNTGARISEALQLCPKDLRNRIVHLHGKGRKDRDVPVWAQTARQLRQWCKSNQVDVEQRIFTNRFGAHLSHDGVAFRLALAVRRAAIKCPSLAGRRITAHTFRHSCAMALLQSGVALEIISLWLGHANLSATHGYIEADLEMKTKCLRRLDEPTAQRRRQRDEPSRLLSFLESVN